MIAKELKERIKTVIDIEDAGYEDDCPIIFYKVIANKYLKCENNQVISFGNGCIASKKIFEENYKIGYMKRDFPSGEYPDSGWRFFVGDEDETYTNDSNNMQIYSLESVIEHDSDIEKYLNAPNESEFIRIDEHSFVQDEGNQKIYITKKEASSPKVKICDILGKNVSDENKIIFEKLAGKIINNKEIKEYFSVECDVDFVDKEILLDKLKYLTEFTKCNYNLEPFACDGTGGIYVILDNKKIGYINSEGGAGIVANNLKDFFSIVTNCGYLGDYAKFNCLKDENEFMTYFNKYENTREKDIIKRFIEENSLEKDSKKIYEIFKNAVMIEPKLLLNTTSDDYVDYEQLFNR